MRKSLNTETGKLERQESLLLDPLQDNSEALAVVCPACNARIGEMCASITSPIKTRSVPHVQRMNAATQAKGNQGGNEQEG